VLKRKGSNLHELWLIVDQAGKMKSKVATPSVDIADEDGNVAEPKDLTDVARTIMTRLLEEDKIHGVTSIAVEEKEAEEEEEQGMETVTSLAAEAINSVIVGTMAGLDEGDLERLCPKGVAERLCRSLRDTHTPRWLFCFALH
jgi:hypothetical protein